MANLDTENKRRAAQQFAPWMVMPVADGAIASEDREQAAGVYSGVPVGSISAPTVYRLAFIMRVS